MIEAKTGKNISGYTAFPNEDEVILGVGTQLRVKNNALKYGGLRVVHLEEVVEDNDQELVSSVASMNMATLAPSKSTLGE